MSTIRLTQLLPGIAALDDFKPPTKNVEASGDFKVADMSLADFGRKEYDLAQFEMPKPHGLPLTRVT